MSNEWNLIELGDLGVLRLRGPDAVRFLQGQVSADVERLTPERSQLTGYHNPQGRAIALLRLVQLAPEDLLAILPRELAAPVANRLGKFVLRAKVKIADDSAGWRVTGLVAPHLPAEPANGRRGGDADESADGTHTSGADAQESGTPDKSPASWAAKLFAEASARAATAGESTSAAAQLEEANSIVDLPAASALMLPGEINEQSSSDTTVIVRVGATPARWLVISPADLAVPLTGCAAGMRDMWRLLDIAAGWPAVYASTSEEFVAQMLNLDALGGIAFDKGCYTGQEVIARAHYRGRVKRRLQRFLTREPATLSVGQSGQLSDGRAFKVVDAAVLANGRCEFLAVAPLVAGAPDAEAGDASGTGTVGAGIDAEALPLPYQLPQ